MESLIYDALYNLPTLGLVVAIFISLLILGKAADYLVDEAIVLSIIWGIPQVIIGATIVSLGTTIPELTVSVMAALNENPDLALGNAIGSIITNTSLILGAAALIHDIAIDQDLVVKQGRVLLGSVVMLTLSSLPFLYEGGQGRVTRFMGLVFLLVLGIYIYRSIILGKESDKDDLEQKVEDGSIVYQILKIFAGVIFVILSSKILIPSVEIGASRMGIPQSVIAATLVAFGTSVPELMTAVTAARKGHGELAVGNVIGANILNVLFVVGLSALVSPGGLLFPTIYYRVQVPMMFLVTIAFLILGLNKEKKFTQVHGVLLLFAYLVYLALNYIF